MEDILVHPTYFPSIVQMVAIVQAKKIFFEVEDNYQKQTYRNRAYVAHTNGKLLLNIPIKHSKVGKRQKTKEVEIEDNFPWQSQHWKSLQTAYRTSPYFEFYEDDIKHLFEATSTSLLEHNLKTFKTVCDLLGIELDSKIEKTTYYDLSPTAVKDLRFLVNAKQEKKYNLTPYNQVFENQHGFLSNLSILDLIFNEGTNALIYLENQKIKF